MTARVVVTGLGSEFRRDDGVGVAVARAVIERHPIGPDAFVTSVDPFRDPTDLLDLWEGAELAVVVDATRTGAAPGTICMVELDHAALPGGDASSSTHGLGFAAVLRLAHAMQRAPRRVVLIGIEGADFSAGKGLTAAVDHSIGEASDMVADLIRRAAPCA
jgi:hydrogenase maturation protease